MHNSYIFQDTSDSVPTKYKIKLTLGRYLSKFLLLMHLFGKINYNKKI